MDALIKEYNDQQLKAEVPEFGIGDTIRVSIRIIEGEKERLQVFQGTVIARKGSGLSETFSMHRVSYGEGMERVFMLHSPRIAQIEVMKKGAVRRAKLYYLRGTTGKKAKVQEKIGARPKKKTGPKTTTPKHATEEIATEALTETVETATQE